MADCTKYRALLSSYADNALTDAEKNALEGHLKDCPSCRALLDAYRSFSSQVEESMVEPPEDFTAGVMQKIKALKDNPIPFESISQDTGARVPAKKKNTYKPVIISFVAAAACLALAFVISPQLFRLPGLTNGTSEAAKVPQASSAPMASYYSTQSSAEDADLEMADSAAKAVDTGAGQAESMPNPSPEPAPMVGATMETGTPVASAQPPTLQATGRAENDGWSGYYAVVTVKGPLPENLEGYGMTDNGDGTYNIEVPANVAVQLIDSGFPAEMGGTDKETALVVYVPE